MVKGPGEVRALTIDARDAVAVLEATCCEFEMRLHVGQEKARDFAVSYLRDNACASGVVRPGNLASEGGTVFRGLRYGFLGALCAGEDGEHDQSHRRLEDVRHAFVCCNGDACPESDLCSG